MGATIDSLHDDLVEVKKDLALIKSLLEEDFELSDHAKKALKEARKTPEYEYIELDEL